MGRHLRPSCSSERADSPSGGAAIREAAHRPDDGAERDTPLPARHRRANGGAAAKSGSRSTVLVEPRPSPPERPSRRGLNIAVLLSTTTPGIVTAEECLAPPSTSPADLRAIVLTPSPPAPHTPTPRLPPAPLVRLPTWRLNPVRAAASTPTTATGGGASQAPKASSLTAPGTATASTPAERAGAARSRLASPRRRRPGAPELTQVRDDVGPNEGGALLAFAVTESRLQRVEHAPGLRRTRATRRFRRTGTYRQRRGVARHRRARLRSRSPAGPSGVVRLPTACGRRRFGDRGPAQRPRTSA